MNLKKWLNRVLNQSVGSTRSRGAAARVRPRLEALEDRVTPASLDLTARGAIGSVNDAVFGSVNNAVFRQFDAQPTGTGYINSFVRLQAQGAKTTVHQGYNTDARPLQFDENNSPQFTRSIRLSDLPKVNLGGVAYRELLLDINQKASQPLLSLDELRVYAGGAPNAHRYDSVTQKLYGLSAVYDLDDLEAGCDNWIKLDARLNQGSGKGDMLAYLPDAAFAGQDEAANVYLYSKFGVNHTPNAGFEEWAAGKELLTSEGSIGGTVFATGTRSPLANVTVFLDLDQNGVLNGSEVYTTTDCNGMYAFSALATGLGAYSTYSVGIVPPPEATAAPPSVSVELQTNSPRATVNFCVSFSDVIIVIPEDAPGT